MKINKGFIFLFDFILNTMPNFAGDIYYNPTKQSPLLGSLQPFVDIAKDFLDTFKPYKSKAYLKKDALQPFRGILHILKGIIYILALPLCLLNPDKRGITALAWLIHGLSQIAQGSIQIITSIPNYLFRIPLRLLITCFSPPTIAFEKRQSLYLLLTQAENELDKGQINNAADICFEIHRKFKGVIARHDVTRLDEQKESICWSKINIISNIISTDDTGSERKEPTLANVRNYMNFFQLRYMPEEITTADLPTL